MEIFILPQKKLGGPIEGRFALWNKATIIRLDDNLFTGTLPETLDQEMPSLRTLRLSGNELRGQIPASLGNFANLQDLRLDNNELTGSIPPTLQNLGSLCKFVGGQWFVARAYLIHCLLFSET